MKIYFISVDHQNTTLKLLTDACTKRGINYEDCPCFFPRCQLLTGTDIAGQMVEYLSK